MAEAFRTAPIPTDKLPPGIPFIIGNEAAERFSYYGMRSILVVFMTEYLLNASGQADPMTNAQARAWYHLFAQAVYFLPLLGSILSDGLWGKYKTVMRLSVVYCIGHAVLAFDQSRTGLAIGLGLIAMGSGGIKPCVTAIVGDQFGASNKHLVSRVFSWFYFSINFGSFFATLLIPYLLKVAGPHVAFGLPGLLMFLATFIFWLGRREFVHVPPQGMGFVREAFSKDGLKAMGKLAVLVAFLAPYYSLFDQTGSAWVLQAKQMDLNFLGFELLPSQVHAANPILVMLFAPLFAYSLYPFVERFTPFTPLRKMGTGLFFVVLSFAMAMLIESWIQAGERPTIWWQMVAYALITAGEVLLSITSLEFFYTQAPRSMKSALMALKFLAISAGNFFTVMVNVIIQRDDGTSALEGTAYYGFFTAVMLVTAITFIFVARKYPVKDYLQEEAAGH